MQNDVNDRLCADSKQPSSTSAGKIRERHTTTKNQQEQLLRAQPKQFVSQARVMLGLTEVGHFVGRGFGANYFDELVLFLR